jgi:hypothetical protein
MIHGVKVSSFFSLYIFLVDRRWFLSIDGTFLLIGPQPKFEPSTNGHLTHPETHPNHPARPTKSHAFSLSENPPQTVPTRQTTHPIVYPQ